MMKMRQPCKSDEVKSAGREKGVGVELVKEIWGSRVSQRSETDADI